MTASTRFVTPFHRVLTGENITTGLETAIVSTKVWLRPAKMSATVGSLVVLFSFATMVSTLIVGWAIALTAMLTGATITLDFNKFGEGWLEVAGLSVALASAPLVYVRFRKILRG